MLQIRLMQGHASARDLRVASRSRAWRVGLHKKNSLSLSLSLTCQYFTTLSQHREDGTKNKPPSPHASTPPHTPLSVRTKRRPPLPLLVRKYADKRADHNSAFNLPDLAPMGDPLPGPDPDAIRQIPLDVPDQRADREQHRLPGDFFRRRLVRGQIPRAGLGRAGVRQVRAVRQHDS